MVWHDYCTNKIEPIKLTTMIEIRKRNIKISLLDNRGGFLLECSSWVDAMFLDQRELVKIMLADIKDYMTRHRKSFHNFNTTHCGYDNACSIGGFSFCGNNGNQIYFDEMDERHFVLVSKLYEAFYNDAFMPILD